VAAFSEDGASTLAGGLPLRRSDPPRGPRILHEFGREAAEAPSQKSVRRTIVHGVDRPEVLPLRASLLPRNGVGEQAVGWWPAVTVSLGG
jgi:hypothetical protein